MFHFCYSMKITLAIFALLAVGSATSHHCKLEIYLGTYFYIYRFIEDHQRNSSGVVQFDSIFEPEITLPVTDP